MAFSLSNIFKPKVTKVDPEIIEQLYFKGGTKFAKNETNIVYADVEELGGFSYLKTVIIGDTSVKIKRIGCTLLFNFKNDTIKLNSDNTDIESNKIKGTNVYYTEIDFELDESDAKKINSEKVIDIQYNFKNIISIFKTI